MDDLNRLANTEFLRIVVGEIEPALVAHKVPLNHDTKLAFLVGAMVSNQLEVELCDDELRARGVDPAKPGSLVSRALRR